MSRTKTINVRDAWLSDVLVEGDQPVLVFKNRQSCVRVHVHDYTLGTIGQKAHEHLNYRQRTIDNTRKRLRGEA